MPPPVKRRVSRLQQLPFIAPMKTRSSLRIAAACLALAAASCQNYSTVSEKRPGYHSATPAGEMIVHALRHPVKPPEAQMGRYIDAAAAAGAILEKNPNDAQALKDYNYAVSRLFEVLHESGLEPWKAPVKCPGAERRVDFLRRFRRQTRARSIALPHHPGRPLSVQRHAGQRTLRQRGSRSTDGHRQQGL